MPLAPQLANRVITETNLPYISNQNVTFTEARFMTGSSDILTSIAGQCERRPGFSDALEPTPTTFNNLQRVFTWDDFNNNFYTMVCDINASNQAVVYKFQNGVDSSASAIFTDTGSSTPFDFAVSNATVYFSNGHVAKKWNATNGISNWGIAIGSINNAIGPNTAGSGANGTGSSNNWTNPNNVTSAVSYATVTTPNNNLVISQFGFAIPSANTISGIQLTMQVIAPTTAGFSLLLSKNGNSVGSIRTQFPSVNTATTLTFGGTSDLWGTTWTPNDINQTTFGAFLEPISGPNGQSISVRNVQITIYGTGGPTIAVAAGAGSMSATTGYQYVFCYGNSSTGHISSPTPPSLSTGIFTNKANVQVSLTASTDAQVNQIRLFRSTDGGAGPTGGTFFELPTSPYPNTTQNITENAADTALNIFSIAPIAGFNDPPPPMRGISYFSGRFWGVAGNKVPFSGLEEIPNGVPEESFPSGPAGNFWSFDQQPQTTFVAGQVDNQVLGVLCPGRVYAITGNTLDTFRRFTVSKRRGGRNPAGISELGGMAAWYDTGRQVWATDGGSLQELSIPVRPDFANVSATNATVMFHASGNAHWLIVNTKSKLLLYDLDSSQWMPPWNFACNYLYSGETSAGVYDLIAATPTKLLKLNLNKFNDNGSVYQPSIKTNLFSMVPDYGRRFSYIGEGSYNEPARTGVPWFVQVTTNNFTPTDVKILADDDPTTGTYQTIGQNLKDVSITYGRKNGMNVVQSVYGAGQPTCRWLSINIVLALLDQHDILYEWFISYDKAGGH